MYIHILHYIYIYSCVCRIPDLEHHLGVYLFCRQEKTHPGPAPDRKVVTMIQLELI